MVFLKYKERYMGVKSKEGVCKKRVMSEVYEYYRRGSWVGERERDRSSIRDVRREVVRQVVERKKEYTEEDQLKYIMPKEILKEMGIEKDWDEEISYEWAYCDHFWEADVIVTRIPRSL